MIKLCIILKKTAYEKIKVGKIIGPKKEEKCGNTLPPC
jgi:hypothetical protein